MTGAIEDVGETLALTRHIFGSCTVLEGVNPKARTVDLRDSQLRVSGRSLRIAGCSIDAR